MIVRQAQKTLLSKLKACRVVLLKALPRTGRKTLLDAIIQDSPAAYARTSSAELSRLESHEIQTSYAGQTLFIDKIEFEHTGAVNEIVRSCLELMPSAVRFVLVGCDVKTEQKLCGALAGLIGTVELPPIQVLESFDDSKPLQSANGPSLLEEPQAQSTNLPSWDQNKLWLRGGLPESLCADSDELSFKWRKDYISNVFQQDFQNWGIDASDRFSDVLQWIANNNGGALDETNCANKLLVKRGSVRNSLELLEKIGVVRKMRNWPAGSNSSLNAMAQYYIRDSGLLHTMLGIRALDDFTDGKARGHSWESFAIESIINAAPENATPAFYRDKHQNEIDLVLNFPNKRVYAIELKVSENKGAEKGFATACETIGATDRMVVHSGNDDKIPEGGVPRLSLISAIRSLSR